MKIEDYEKAIEALGCHLYIDEFKLYHNHVRRCFAHGSHILVFWDETGRGFSLPVEERQCDRETHELFEEYDYMRDEVFDLCFI